MNSKHKGQSGFTLVELAIVLVIIGLIISGVFGGQVLIKQARLQSVIRDVQSFTAAVNTFQLKYEELPGDFRLARNYWQEDDPDVRNGNGDGKVLNLQTNCDADGSCETIFAWRHLQLAGLIGGGFTGASSATPIPGVNVPKSRVAGTGFLIHHPSAVELHLGRDELMIRWASIFTSAGGSDWDGGLAGDAANPEDAYSIDFKMDDGLPNSGNVTGTSISASGSSGSIDSAKCQDIDARTGTGSVKGSDIGRPVDAPYKYNSDQRECMMFFMMGI